MTASFLIILQVTDLAGESFTAQLTEDSKKTMPIAWGDIASMMAYKVDLITCDELHLDIALRNGTVLKLTEDTEGWVDFCQFIKKIFPTISPSWDIDLMFPAFEQNQKVIYQHHSSEGE